MALTAVPDDNVPTQRKGRVEDETIAPATKPWSGWRSRVAPTFALRRHSGKGDGASMVSTRDRNSSSPPLARTRSRIWRMGGQGSERTSSAGSDVGAVSTRKSRRFSSKADIPVPRRMPPPREQERALQSSHPANSDHASNKNTVHPQSPRNATEPVAAGESGGNRADLTRNGNTSTAGPGKQRRIFNSSTTLAEVDALIYTNIQKRMPVDMPQSSAWLTLVSSPGVSHNNEGQQGPLCEDEASEVAVDGWKSTAVGETSTTVASTRSEVVDKGSLSTGPRDETSSDIKVSVSIEPTGRERAEMGATTSRTRISIDIDEAACDGANFKTASLNQSLLLDEFSMRDWRASDLAATTNTPKVSSPDKSMDQPKSEAIEGSTDTASCQAQASNVVVDASPIPKTRASIEESRRDIVSLGPFMRAIPGECGKGTHPPVKTAPEDLPVYENGIGKPAHVDRYYDGHENTSQGGNNLAFGGKGPKTSSCSVPVKCHGTVDAEGAVTLRELIREELEKTHSTAAVSEEVFRTCIPLLCARNGSEISSKIREFLGSGRKVLLLTGEAGGGKSLFAASLARDLIADTSTRGGFLPVLLDARKAEGKRGMSLDSLLENYFTQCLRLSENAIEMIKNRQRLLVIVDGFDRISPSKRRNLWTSNGWADWRAKLLVTSRQIYLGDSTHSLERMFVPTDRKGDEKRWALETAAIAPLDPRQVEAYHTRMGLHNLCSRRLARFCAFWMHPLSLGLACESKVTPVGHPDQATRASVVSSWLKYRMGAEHNAEGGSALVAAEELAVCIYEAGRWTTDVQPEGDALSSVMIPLRNDLWSFARSTLLEYLVASHVRRRVLGEAPEDGERDSTNQLVSWIGRIALMGGVRPLEPTAPPDSRGGSSVVLGFLSEMCSTDEPFAARLVQIVEMSRDGQQNSNEDELASGVGVASAYAMTILCRSGYSFSGRDLSSIKVAGAVMDGGVFDGCSFAGADLTGCSLRNASLRRCNFAKARCSRLDLGALPAVKPFAGRRTSPRADTEQTTTMTVIERATFSPDGEVLALLATGGLFVKVLKTDSMSETCTMFPRAGRLFSTDLLEMSPDCSNVLVHTMENPEAMTLAGIGGKRLELRHIQEGEARLLFETAALPEAPVPAFSWDSSIFIHQHGENELGVVDCASGDSVDLISLKLTAAGTDDAWDFGESGDKACGNSHAFGGHESDGEWKDDAEDVEEGERQAVSPAQRSNRRTPKICSLRVSPDGARVQVGVLGGKGIILEYALDGWQGPRHLRVGHEVLRGRRIIDAPPASSGLHAVLGPEHVVQIRSWRKTGDHSVNGNNSSVNGNDSSMSGSGSGNSEDQAPSGGEPTCAIVEREIVRLCSGKNEKVEEAAFAADGDFFFTRSPGGGRASLWSIKPEVHLVQTFERVCSRATPAAFFSEGKAIAMAHEDCSIKVYACETGKILLAQSVPSPALAVAVVTTSTGRSILLAIAGETIYRWYTPSWSVMSTRPHVNDSVHYDCMEGGVIRAAAALPSTDGWIVLLAREGGLVAMDTKRGSILEMISNGGHNIRHVAVTPDGMTVMSIDEHQILEWDAWTFEPKGRRSLHAEVRSLAFSQDSTLLALLTYDGIFVVEVGTGLSMEELVSFGREADCRMEYQRRDDPVQLAFWDNRTLAIALSRGRIQLHDVSPRKRTSISPIPSTPSSSISTRVGADWVAHSGPVTCMATRPSDAGRATRTSRLDLNSSYSSSMHSLYFTRLPVLATGGGDGKVKVWTEEGRAGGGDEDLDEDFVCGQDCLGKAAGRTAGHEGAVLSVCWHPGGEIIASAGQDWAVWLWDSDGRPFSYIQAHRRWTQTLSFSHNGNVLVSYGDAGVEGWAVDVSVKNKGATLKWRRPLELVATMAEIGDTEDLGDEPEKLLYERGAKRTAAAGSRASYGPASGMCPSCRRKASVVSIFPTSQPPSRAVRFDLGYGEENLCQWTNLKLYQSESDIDDAHSLIWPRGDDLEATDGNQMTWLALAAKHGAGRRTEALLEAGANVDAEDDQGYTPLCWAAAGGYSTILRALLFRGVDNENASPDEDGADPDHTTAKGNTPAILAASGGHLCALAELEEAAADLDRSNHAGETPLIVASRGGHAEAVAFLTGLVGTDLNRRDTVGGLTALAAATLNGHTESVRVLLMRGADPRIPTRNGRTPVHLAAVGGHLPALRLLLEALEPDRDRETWRPDVAGCTPVMSASANGHLQCLQVLVEEESGNSRGGVKTSALQGLLDQRNPDPFNPASVPDGAESVENLGLSAASKTPPRLADGAINNVDHEGRTALMHACILDQPQCVDYLLRKGARLEITDKNDVSTIMVASGGGHASCLSQILAAVKDKRILDATDAYGNNATHYACLSGESRALAILAEAGASLDIPSGPSKVGNAMHPAHIAVAYGFLSCLAELAKCSTNLEARDGSGETVLSLAIRCGSKSCVEFLLSGDSHRGALVKPDLPGKGAELPLHVAASLGRLSLVSLLLGAGAKPTARDGAGETALHVAARFGHAETVSALLEACEHDGSEGYTGTGPRRRSIARWWSMMTNSGETATFLAAREGFLGVCRALASAGALDPSFANSEGVTPIMVATLAGHEEVVQTLILGGGDVNGSDSKGRTPAMAAALRGDRPMLECLFAHGARLAARNSDGRTAAFFAAMNGHIDSLAFIVEESGDMEALATADARDKIGCTPLWTAAAHGHLETLRYLTRCYASPNARDITGTTALWMTVGAGNAPCLSVLLEADADVDLANEDGLTPALIAAQGGHSDCLRMLAAAGADLELTDLAGNSCAAFAAMGGHVDCLNVLTAAGADIDIPNTDSHTPVFAAITWSRLDCLCFLASEDANLRHRDFVGNTPAMVAASHGQTECLQFIVETAGLAVLSDRNHEGMSAACFAALCGRELTLLAIGQIDRAILREQDRKTRRSAAHYAAAEGQLSCLRILADATSDTISAETTKARKSEGGVGIGTNSAGAAALVTRWFKGRHHTLTRHPLADYIDLDGESPLHAAARGGHMGAFTYLASEAGLSPEDRNGRGETCLWLAAAYDQVELLRLLVDAGLSVNIPDIRGRSPVHVAASRNSVNALVVLSEAGRIPRSPAESRGGSRSSELGDVHQSLLDVDVKDADGSSSLHLAAAAGHLDAVAILCDAGADINAIDGAGQTCVWRAASTGQGDMLELLASKGANLDTQTNTGATLAHIAARYGGADCLRVLCERGVDVDAVNQAGNTPLIFTTVVNDVEGVKLLARYGCDLNRGDIQSVTPIFFAAQEGYTECLALLLSLGANGSVARADGATPLIIAAQNGHEQCVATLLNPPGLLFHRGSFSEARNYCTPSNGTRFVVDHSPSPRPPREGIESHTSSGCTALIMAVVAGQWSCAKLLLEAGADVNATDGKERSSLYLAAAAGNERMCSLLISRGADPKRKALDNFEPTVTAAKHGHLGAARRILKDARIDPDDIIADHTTGRRLSQYLTDIEQHNGGDDSIRVNGNVASSRTSSVGGTYNAQSRGKPVAPLLPASVARLRANGRPPASPGSRGINDMDSHTTRRGSRSRDGLPPRGMPSKSSATMTTVRNGSPCKVPRPHSVSPSDRAGILPSLGGQPRETRTLQRTWSGVHGGQASAPPGTDTPRRRTPVLTSGRDGEFEFFPIQPTPLAKGREMGQYQSSSSIGHERDQYPPQQEQHQQHRTNQQHSTLFDRMTTFLFDMIDGDHKSKDKGERAEELYESNGQQQKNRGEEPRRRDKEERVVADKSMEEQHQQRQRWQSLQHRKVPREIVAL